MKRRAGTKATTPPDDRPVLLAGGNPQIAKGFGPEQVEEYLAALPGWKQAACREVHGVVLHVLPAAEMAVKWNSPFYGVERGRWFLSIHAMTRYLKLAFFDGQSLEPPPSVSSKQPGVRYLHLNEGAPLDGGQLADWLRQAILLPGVRL